MLRGKPQFCDNRFLIKQNKKERTLLCPIRVKDFPQFCYRRLSSFVHSTNPKK